MRGCMTLKEVQEVLIRTLACFAPLVRSSLEAWFEAASTLPQHVQHSNTVAAIKLVSEALQQAPTASALEVEEEELSESPGVGWLQKHLPALSTAMQACINSHLDISNKRLGVLSSLVNTGHRTETDKAQLLSQCLLEVKLWLVLEVFASVFYLVLPLAAVASSVSWSRSRDANSATQRSQSSLQSRLQQGNNLLSRVGLSMESMLTTGNEVKRRVDHILNQVDDLGLQDPEDADEIEYWVWEAQHILAVGAFEWLMLAMDLPPNHPVAVQFISHIDWDMLCAGILTKEDREDLLAQGVLCSAFAQPHLLSFVTSRLSPDRVQHLLHEFDVTVQHLQDAGMPASQAQQLLSERDVTGSANKPDIQHRATVCNTQLTARQPTGSSSSNTAHSHRGTADEQVVPGSQGTTGSTDPELAQTSGSKLVAEEHGDLDDMQTLLRLMYGCHVRQVE